MDNHSTEIDSGRLLALRCVLPADQQSEESAVAWTVVLYFNTPNRTDCGSEGKTCWPVRWCTRSGVSENLVIKCLQLRNRENFLTEQVRWVRTIPEDPKTAIPISSRLQKIITPRVYLSENLFYKCILSRSLHVTTIYSSSSISLSHERSIASSKLSSFNDVFLCFWRETVQEKL
jgi:hypothetical protein